MPIPTIENSRTSSWLRECDDAGALVLAFASREMDAPASMRLPIFARLGHLLASILHRDSCLRSPLIRGSFEAGGTSLVWEVKASGSAVQNSEWHKPSAGRPGSRLCWLLRRSS